MANATHSRTPMTLWAGVLILLLIALRLFSLTLFPLFDTTEARYGEMARIMAETGNWITPQFDYNIPFWGKPPLQTWISALSFTLFGVSEFTARLPHFLCGLLILGLVFRMACQELDRERAITAVLILVSSMGFIAAAGIVMPDAALSLAMTLSMVSFWRSFKYGEQRLYGNLFFVGLALGMLVKGPVTIVLAAIALGLWGLYHRNLVESIRALPWLSGGLLFCAITLPWYIFAELRTPGFLEYFLVGEHFNRFLVPGWKGDLYGNAHREPKGMVWLFWVGMAFPWSFLLLKMGVSQIWQKRWQAPKPVLLKSYLFFWMIAPMVLFTAASNVLATYVLPGFAAMALLLAFKLKPSFRLHGLALVSTILIGLLICLFMLGKFNKSAESDLLGKQWDLNPTTPLYYWEHRPFSAQFYSKGQAEILRDVPELEQLILGKSPFFIAVEHKTYPKMELLFHLTCTEQKRTDKRILLKCN